MLTRAWFKLRYHSMQAEAWRTRARFVGLPCGRGSGKTEICRRYVVRWLPVRKPWADPMYFYAMPTYNQARRVAWPALKALVPDHWFVDGNRDRGISDSRMVITTKFGSSLHVMGMDKPQRIEGNQWDGGVIDESCDQKPGIFDRSILPALMHRRGWCRRIGVPKRQGPGAVEFRAFCERAQRGDDPEERCWTWPSSSVLSETDLRYARQRLSAKDYAEQFDALWQDASGLVFYAFDDKLDVSDEIGYRDSERIVVGSDFNVDPMAWVLCHDTGDGLEVFDELWQHNTNTKQSLDVLYLKYGKHDGGWDFVGDATGRARKTAASESDYMIIRNDRRFRGARVFYPKANPRRSDRFASCNALFSNAEGQRRVKIHPRCKNLVADLKCRAYVEGTTDADDYGDVGHISDGFGYAVWWKYPMKLDRGAHLPRIVTGSIPTVQGRR